MSRPSWSATRSAARSSSSTSPRPAVESRSPAWFWGESGWEAEWALPQGWPSADTELPPTFLFHSRDDEEAPFTHLELYAERLPGAEVHPLDGNGHLFDRGDLTEIVAAIRGLAAG
jgi:pimeloyl-ACP methyl ester carboxylesterase